MSKSRNPANDPLSDRISSIIDQIGKEENEEKIKEICVEAIKSIKELDKNEYVSSGYSRSTMLTLAKSLKKNNATKSTLTALVTCYHKSYLMSEKYEKFLKQLEYKGYEWLGFSYEASLLKQIFGNDRGDVIVTASIGSYYKAERDEVIDGLLQIAAYDSKDTLEQVKLNLKQIADEAKLKLADIYSRRFIETPPDFHGILHYFNIVGDEKDNKIVNQENSKLINIIVEKNLTSFLLFLQQSLGKGEQLILIEAIASQLAPIIEKYHKPNEIKKGICELGKLYEKLGNSAKALEYYKKAAGLGEPSAHIELGKVYEEKLLGQDRNVNEAAGHYFQAANIYFEEYQKKFKNYLIAAEYRDALDHKGFINNSSPRMKQQYKNLKNHGQMKIDGMRYLEKAMRLSSDSITPYLNSNDLEKIKYLETIKNELKDPPISPSLSVKIDKKFVEIMIKKCEKALIAADGNNWMSMLLSVAKDIQDKKINDDQWRENVNAQVKALFDHYLKTCNEKYLDLPIPGKQPIMNKRDNWERIFHHMLEMRYAPRGESNPIVQAVLDMLKNPSSKEIENSFYAKCLLHDFYIKELAFAKVALKGSASEDKIKTIQTELIKLCDAILKDIPKIDK
jgi:tetratricopeptide (TPR) repeat protein